MTDFLLFKKSSFSEITDIFENHQLHISKALLCVLFLVIMCDQTHYSLINLFSNYIVQDWRPLSVLKWNFKGHLNSIIM